VDDIWALLGRAGLQRPGPAGPAASSFDALADPAAIDALAAMLAARLRPLEPDLVVVWDGLNSAVLGYAVGLRLRVPVAVLSDDEGLVRSVTPLQAGAHAVLVAVLSPDAPVARMAASYLESQGVALAASAALLARPGGRDSTIALAELPPEESEPGALPRQGTELTPGQGPDPNSRQEGR
jgi:hypothetical protein